MALPELTAWQADQLRLTAFPSEGETTLPEEWWTMLIGTAPDTLTVRPKAGLHEQVGSVEGRNLTLRLQPERIDWLLGPIMASQPEEELPDTPPSAGPLPETLAFFTKIATEWIKVAPSITRLAFGAILRQPVEDRKAGYVQLGQYLPSVSLDPAASDFLYQINRPRESATGVKGLKINRLTKWSVVLVRRLGLTLTLGKDATAKAQQATLESACRLELDINTAPDFHAPLPHESLVDIFQELVALGTEIAAKGDIP